MTGLKVILMTALGFAVLYGINAAAIISNGGTVTIPGMTP